MTFFQLRQCICLNASYATRGLSQGGKA